jgi:antitoxin (DNA-binding transcriptional repressor) of toxin-antitoxin stability system
VERINVTQAARNLSELLNKVAYQGASFELERGKKVIARLMPARTASPMKAKDLNDFFAKLPPLGDDAEGFSRDLEELGAKLLPEPEPWT